MKALKQTTLVIAVLISGIFGATAQDNSYYDQFVRYGVKGGINLANVKNLNGNTKTGFVAGIFAEYGLSNNFAIRSEANFSVQGSKSESSAAQVKLNYINWPILAKYYATNVVSIEAGPQIGFLLSGKGGGLPKSAYRALDLGLAFGLGYSITENLEIGGRYNLGLTNIAKTSSGLKNSVFQFTLAYAF